MRMIDADALIEVIKKYKFGAISNESEREYTREIMLCFVNGSSTAYDVDKVVAEVKKLDLDGVSMVEDGKYKLVRKNEVISLIQTNGVCNGRLNTCADCYKMNCPLSTEKTFTDKWSEEVRKGGVE